MLGTGEMLLIAVVAIIVVDPKKLPDLMKGLGKAINEFKSMSGEFKRSMEREGEAAEFERRKAEAQEQLFGSGASKTEGAQGAQEQVAAPDSEPPQTPAQAPSPASAQAPAAEAKTQPEPQYEDVAQPPVERAAQTEASAPVEAAAPVAEPAPPAPVEAAAPAPVEEAAAAPVEAAAPPAPAAEPAPPAPAEAAAPPAPVEEAAAPAPVEESAPPAASGGEAPPPPPLSGDEAVGEGHAGRMSLFDHLGDLRKRLTRSAIAVVVGFLAAYAFAGKMMKILMQPMLDALKQSHFIYTVPTEAFFAEMWVAFIAGMFLVSPYIFYQIWGFVAPGLYSHERRWIIPITLASALFFTVGALFGYFVVFPFGFEFFASYTSEILVFMPKLDDYLGFALKLLFAFGIVFELPLFLFFLAKLGIVTHVGLRAKRKYAILSAFIVAAALTPPDAISQTMMAVPLCILYEVGIWLAFFFGKKPKPQEPEAPAAA